MGITDRSVRHAHAYAMSLNLQPFTDTTFLLFLHENPFPLSSKLMLAMQKYLMEFYPSEFQIKSVLCSKSSQLSIVKIELKLWELNC